MFDKKYILEKLYPIVCLDIIDKEKRIKFGLRYFNNSISDDIENIIKATRELERDTEHYIKQYERWIGKGEPEKDSY